MNKLAGDVEIRHTETLREIAAEFNVGVEELEERLEMVTIAIPASTCCIVNIPCQVQK